MWKIIAARNSGDFRLMAMRAGTANLPLHGGQVPKWLADRMTRLGAVISEAIVHHYGRDELLGRLAHPFWFQSFGAVMGMDWHSFRRSRNAIVNRNAFDRRIDAQGAHLLTARPAMSPIRSPHRPARAAPAAR
jgi:hypothetical protein